HLASTESPPEPPRKSLQHKGNAGVLPSCHPGKAPPGHAREGHPLSPLVSGEDRIDDLVVTLAAPNDPTDHMAMNSCGSWTRTSRVATCRSRRCFSRSTAAR